MERESSQANEKSSSAALYVIALLFIGVLVFAYFYNSNKADEAGNGYAGYFQERMIALGIEDIGHPIEGFDDNLLMAAFPGLVVSDFNNVETFEGHYEVTGGSSIFVREPNKPISSAERTISEQGYATLLSNVSVRLGISLNSESSVDALIDGLNTSDSLQLGVGEEGQALGVGLRVEEILEDSRCPLDVTCIQAGTVRVRATLTSGLGEAEQIFTLGQPITTEAQEVVLEQVLPPPYASQEIDSDDYVFRFRVSKRPAMESIVIEAQYEDRLVYRFNQSGNTESLRAHCSAQGGVFNECGYPCAPDAEACVAVCALTCELSSE